jgi:hypothetical protein
VDIRLGHDHEMASTRDNRVGRVWFKETQRVCLWMLFPCRSHAGDVGSPEFVGEVELVARSKIGTECIDVAVIGSVDTRNATVKLRTEHSLDHGCAVWTWHQNHKDLGKGIRSAQHNIAN